jgi:putative glutamine amidotransferase
MKSSKFKRISILVFVCLLIVAGSLFIKPPEGHADSALHVDAKVKLAIFWPQVFHVKVLSELRNKGLLDIDNLEVTGIYHEKEISDFDKPKEYVRENNIDWFKFRELKGELSMETIFQENGCTADFKDIFETSDGIIFFGGHDIQPQIYGQKTSILSQIRTPYRHLLALSMVFHLLGGFQDENFAGFLETNLKYPVLGICLGFQTLNVGTGGSLLQDIWMDGYGKMYLEDIAAIPIELLHRNPYARLYPEEKLTMWLMHPIKLSKGGKFCSTFGFSPDVNPLVSSAHHQMLDKLGKGMKVIATSLDDKVIEAIEHERFPNVLGVQFHPELTWLWDKTTTFRFLPEYEKEKSLATILEQNPPSYEFHKKLWQWFAEMLKDTHHSREHH